MLKTNLVNRESKKNTEHTRMYIFFLDFLHHYSQQRSAVRSTASTFTLKQNTLVVRKHSAANHLTAVLTN